MIEQLGTVLEISYTVRGAVDGPILGLFVLGIFFPWAGKKGAIMGTSTSLLVMLYIIIGAKWHKLNNRIRFSNLPMSVDNCSYPLNEPKIENVTFAPLDVEDKPMILFQISFLYYTMLGTFITIVVAVITSFLVKESDTSKINPDHVSPIVRR